MVRPLLFVPGANPRASFVRTDAYVLGRHFELREIARYPGACPRLRATMCAAWLILTRRVSLVYVWFAAVSYAPLLTFCARLVHVPVVIITGGADVANQPDIGFGDGRLWWRRILVARTLEAATLVVPFSASARREVEALVPRARTDVIAPGVVLPRCQATHGPRDRLVLTVSAITASTLSQKGLETFVRAASLVPDARFVVVGAHAHAASVDRLRALAGANVELAGALADAELQRLYCAARVYAQLSAHEGFGLAVVEAMAAGCHVVVTDRGSLPEVVREHGWYVRYGDANHAARAIAAALAKEPPADRRAELDGLYGVSHREQELMRALAPLMGDAAGAARLARVGDTAAGVKGRT